ncbi:hypothetical protein D3C78_1271720 [compost metagenome]
MSQNVIEMRFTDESLARQALSELKAASAAGLVQLHQAAVVQRDMQGRLQVKEGMALDPHMAFFEQMAQSLPAGSTAVVATVREFVDDVVNGLARDLAGQVQRRPLSALQAEMDARQAASGAPPETDRTPG